MQADHAEAFASLTGTRLRPLDVARMLREPAPMVPWIVEGVLARGCLTLLPGREGLGKSLYVMALAVGIVTGEPVGPFEVTPGRVMVVDAENGESEIHRRLRALGLAAGAEARLSIYTTEAGDLLNDQAEMESALFEERPDLLVIDSLRSTWRGKENASDEVGPAIDHLRNLARRHDCAVALIHHAGKVGTEYRGSTAIGAGAQIVVHLGRDAGDPEPDRFVLTCHKMRPAQRWTPKWIRLAVEMDALVCLEEAEPFHSEDQPPAPKAPAREQVAPLVRRVLDTASEPLTVAEIARRVSRDPKDRTVRRVLDALSEKGLARIVEGGWEGWQPREALKDAATPATLALPAEDRDEQWDLGGGTDPATSPPQDLVSEVLHQGDGWAVAIESTPRRRAS